MINLKEAITKYPNCLESKDKFKAILSDIYPDRSDKIYIKVLADVIECGIVKDIKEKNGEIDNITLSKYRDKLESTYGYSAKLSIESLLLWVKAFSKKEDIDIGKVSNELNINNVKNTKIHIHNFQKTVVDGTCNQRGYTAEKCAICGYEKRSNFTPYGRHLFEKIDEIPPTCINEGEIEYLCSCCKESKIETIPKVDHIIDERVKVKEATCTEDGLTRGVCKICGKVEEEVIAKTGHKYTDWITQIFATCTEDGSEVRQCENCSEIEERTIKAEGHKFNAWTKDEKNPEDMVRFCLNCGEEERKTYKEYMLEIIEKFKIGNTIKFGNYHGKEIAWQVLDVKDDKALIITKYGIDAKPYNKKYAEITWEKCTLRKWLNSEFLTNAFSKEEQAKILSTNVSADKSPWWGTNPGKATTDKVFLLSISEAEKYFKNDEARECAPTDYAKHHGASIFEGNCYWWLRSPGNYETYAAYVDGDGSFDYDGTDVDFEDSAVRPALWITLES